MSGSHGVSLGQFAFILCNLMFPQLAAGARIGGTASATEPLAASVAAVPLGPLGQSHSGRSRIQRGRVGRIGGSRIGSLEPHRGAHRR